MNIWVFRQADEEREKLNDELEKGKLRQGWGIPGMELEVNGEKVERKEWISKNINNEEIIKQWGGISNESLQKHYNLLRYLVEIKDGDLIVIPKCKNKDQFALAMAKAKKGKTYHCDDGIMSLYGGMDFIHYITINPEKLRVFNYKSINVPNIIERLLKCIAYSRRISRVKNNDFKEALEKCWEMEASQEDLEPSETIEIINAQIAPVIESTYKVINNLCPNVFEKIVRDVLIDNGLTIEETNIYDKEGGDIDIIASKSIDLLEYEEHYEVLLQVKNKVGSDKNDIKGIEQLLQQAKSLNKEDCKKIYINMVKDFTDKTKEKAEKEGILLINGIEFTKLYLKSMI